MTRTQAWSKAKKMAKQTGEACFIVWAGTEDGMDPNSGFQPCTEDDLDAFFAGCEVIDCTSD